MSDAVQSSSDAGPALAMLRALLFAFFIEQRIRLQLGGGIIN